MAADGAATIGAAVLEAVPPSDDEAETWRSGDVVDAIEGAFPLGHRVARMAGPGWLLIGDAAGFLDPFTGEGIHRALVSARLAAEVLGRGSHRSL